jgi:hypothetical protein
VEDMKLKDLKVKNHLFQAIDRTIMETILNKDSTKGIWDSIRQKYQGSTKVKQAQLQALRREFELLGMKAGESVDDYFCRTLTIANKMKSQGECMEQTVIIEKILRSITARFDYVVCSIEESNNLTVMTIDELQSSLLVYEQRMKAIKRKSKFSKSLVERNLRQGRMIDLGAETEVVEDSEAEAEVKEDNLSIKLSLSAIDVIN